MGLEREKEALMFAIKTLRSLQLFPSSTLSTLKAVRHGDIKIHYDLRGGDVARVTIHFNPSIIRAVNVVLIVDRDYVMIKVFWAGDTSQTILIERWIEEGQLKARVLTSSYRSLDLFLARYLAYLALETALYDHAARYALSIVKAV